jgi:hypothetical protein
MSSADKKTEEHADATHIRMPAPTFWPMVFAFGVALILGGMVTHVAVSATGLVIAIRAAFGWWHDVIPHEAHEELAIETERQPAPILVEARSVVRLQLGEGGHRMRIPEKIYPYSSGFWGGLAGGTAMAGLACLYGLIAQHSIWYPINLLAGVVIPDLGNATLEQLRAFNPLAFGAAFVGHGVISVLGWRGVCGDAADVSEVRAILGGYFDAAVLERTGGDDSRYRESGDERAH